MSRLVKEVFTVVIRQRLIMAGDVHRIVGWQKIKEEPKNTIPRTNAILLDSYKSNEKQNTTKEVNEIIKEFTESPYDS